MKPGMPGNYKIKSSPGFPWLQIPRVIFTCSNDLYFKGTFLVKGNIASPVFQTYIVLQEIIACLGDKKLILPRALFFFLTKLILAGKHLASSECLDASGGE